VILSLKSVVHEARNDMLNAETIVRCSTATFVLSAELLRFVGFLPDFLPLPFHGSFELVISSRSIDLVA
jgi:hypothetical protein